MRRLNYTDEEHLKLAADWIASGLSKQVYAHQNNIACSTIRRALMKYETMNGKGTVEQKQQSNIRRMYADIETLPNMGYFFDVYSDRGIPLDFIIKPKAITTIAYKFDGDEESTVLVAATPYNDKDILEEFSRVAEEATHIVGHFWDGFDQKFIEGRLFANGLPAMAPACTVDTYKLAKQKFGKTLNSNKLDHIAQLCGIGRKNKTDALLWVRCAQGEPEALKEMAEYNKQDVELLEAVYHKLAPNVKHKVNHNVMSDSPVNLCNSCGSDDLEFKGYELKANSWRHRFQCNQCEAWSTFAKGKA